MSQTLNSCESSRTLVTVTVNTTTAAPIAYNQYFCSASTVANLVATGTSLKWYTAATGGTALASSTALTTRNYYVSQTMNSIESPRTLVAVTVYGTPVAKAINLPTSSGSVRSPICTSDIKTLTIKAGYSATNLQWEKAVVALNSNSAPASSNYVAINGATGSTYTETNAVAGKNYYRVKFTNGNCNNTASYSTSAIIYYKDCVTVAKVSALSAVSYPNPFVENFNISLSNSKGEKISVAVYDMMGRLMEQHEADTNEVSELQMGNNYPSGMYNVIITQGDEIKRLRVVKKY